MNRDQGEEHGHDFCTSLLVHMEQSPDAASWLFLISSTANVALGILQSELPNHKSKFGGQSFHILRSGSSRFGARRIWRPLSSMLL